MIELLAKELFQSYDSFKLKEIRSRRFTQTELYGWFDRLEGERLCAKNLLGKSGEGRPILLFDVGTGLIKVLLWSQMHGDEPTATMALADMAGFFMQNRDHIITKTIREKLTLLLLPMLNPDGAERFTRRTAQCIDINRDALALATPEARVLADARDRYKPEFGFNLHDQDPHLAVGTSKQITAIALLAPAVDESRTDNAVRLRAKRVASMFTEVMNLFVSGRVAKWDDTYEPRAFGDAIQKSGTSTVLVESGGWRGDPEKFFLRKLNCIGLLMTLYAIATEKYLEADLSLYERLPFNTKLGCDYIIRNARLQTDRHIPPIRVDVGVNFEERIDSATGRVDRFGKIVELGDLRTYAALEEKDAGGVELDASRIRMETLFPASDVQLLTKRN
jgi:hypothetical protein